MSVRSIVQLVGWASIIFGAVLVTGGLVGEGGGAAYEPGADTVRTLIFERGVGHAALGMACVGALLLVVSLVLPKRQT
jgi:hypothetical protein